MIYSISWDREWIPYQNALRAMHEECPSDFKQRWKDKHGVTFRRSRIKATAIIYQKWMMIFESEAAYVLFVLEWS